MFVRSTQPCFCADCIFLHRYLSELACSAVEEKGRQGGREGGKKEGEREKEEERENEEKRYLNDAR